LPVATAAALNLAAPVPMSKQKIIFFAASPAGQKQQQTWRFHIRRLRSPALMPLRCVSFLAAVQHFETHRRKCEKAVVAKFRRKFEQVVCVFHFQIEFCVRKIKLSGQIAFVDNPRFFIRSTRLFADAP
jgi:hypothetical protein